MFGPDFYPTPTDVISAMVAGIDLQGKTVLEPSAGKGNIVDYLAGMGANVIACEKEINLKTILQHKCTVVADDFLTLTGEPISHIDAIIMNPPFSADEKHILHAWDIAPAGALIIALCNSETIKNAYSSGRRRLRHLVNENGCTTELGNCFAGAERMTEVYISMIRLTKPGVKDAGTEFEGFFMDEAPEQQYEGIMQYDAIRDIVNRYVGAIKVFDEQINVGIKMEQLTASFFAAKMGFTATMDGAPAMRSAFKKELQMNAWKWIFDKMNLGKYTTKGLMADINKFIAQQQQVPFTMKNVYRMLEIVIGTTAGRMDRALIEVFEALTMHYDENRYHVEGWKTNSHYLVNEKFIMPGLTEIGWHGELSIRDYQNSRYTLVEDMFKALCYITGKNYDNIIPLRLFVRAKFLVVKDGEILKVDSWGKYSNKEAAIAGAEAMGGEVVANDISWGQWFDYYFFQIRCYKKGTCHFKFKDRDVWALFNQQVARVKGYPLPEGLKKK